jgi:alpha-ketoglutarate-dependent taurine dioxygenase
VEVTVMQSIGIDEPAADALVAGGTRALVVTPCGTGDAAELAAVACEAAARSLSDSGALLFRGFHVDEAAGFHDFAAGFGHDLLSYDFASTPRRRIDRGVYSSTEYPAHQWIPQHNEQSYTLRWPMKIWFYCAIAAARGGETPIADSRAVHRRLDPAIRRRFAERGVLYVRNYGNGLDVPWEDVFGTERRDEVEAFCRDQQIAWEWLDDGALRTRQLCQGEARHPTTGEMLWFNQAHLFHVSGLEPAVRDALLAAVDEIDLPRNAYYGDGTPIEDAVLDEIRAAYEAEMLRFAWTEGDVLMLDNMLMSHGRAPFEGKRRVLVAMAEPWLPPAGRL